MNWLQRAADQGSLMAKNRMGDYYSSEIGNDYTQAVSLYRQTADLGDARGQASLGFMIEQGKGVKQDYAEALKLYQLAADQGNTSGEFGLGMAYAVGIAVEKDYTESKKWFLRAADDVSSTGVDSNYFAVTALSGLGWLAKEERNYDEAIKWYRLAASRGVAGTEKLIAAVEAQQKQEAANQEAQRKQERRRRVGCTEDEFLDVWREAMAKVNNAKQTKSRNCMSYIAMAEGHADSIFEMRQMARGAASPSDTWCIMESRAGDVLMMVENTLDRCF